MDLNSGLLETVQTSLWEPTVHICSNRIFSDTSVRVKLAVAGLFIPEKLANGQLLNIYQHTAGSRYWSIPDKTISGKAAGNLYHNGWIRLILHGPTDQANITKIVAVDIRDLLKWCGRKYTASLRSILAKRESDSDQA